MSDRRIIVTHHAVERARDRYKSRAIRPSDVRADVAAAVAEGREGVRPPKQLEGAETRRGRLQNTRYCWTADFARCFLVKRVRDPRNGYEPVLVVVTAVQGARR